MSEMETVARCCLICKNFVLDMGSEGFGEYTPGSEATISCGRALQKGCAWHEYGDASARGLRSMAERCELFELHPAVAKAFYRWRKQVEEERP